MSHNKATVHVNSSAQEKHISTGHYMIKHYNNRRLKLGRVNNLMYIHVKLQERHVYTRHYMIKQYNNMKVRLDRVNYLIYIYSKNYFNMNGCTTLLSVTPSVTP